jgi:hypothetical protein
LKLFTIFPTSGTMNQQHRCHAHSHLENLLRVEEKPRVEIVGWIGVVEWEIRETAK